MVWNQNASSGGIGPIRSFKAGLENPVPACNTLFPDKVHGRNAVGGRGQAVGDRRNVFPRACVAGIVYPVLHRASNMPRGKTGVRMFSASPVGFQRFVSTVRTEVSFTDRSVDRSLLPAEVIYAAELAG